MDIIDKLNRRPTQRYKLIYVNPNSKPNLLTSNPIPEPYWVDEKILNVVCYYVYSIILLRWRIIVL